MIPDSPQSPREELEARLTALLLGELSADEAAALRHTIEQDPELARLESQLKETIGLVRQAAASNEEKTVEPAAPLQLSAERREKLLASFKPSPLEMAAKPRRTFRLNRELLKLAAMVVALLLVGGVVVSYFTTRSMREMVAVEGDLDLATGSFLAGVPAGDAEQAKPVVVTVLAEPAPARGGVKPLESPATPNYGAAPASGRRSVEYSLKASEGGRTPPIPLSRANERNRYEVPSAQPAVPPRPSVSDLAPAEKQLMDGINNNQIKATTLAQEGKMFFESGRYDLAEARLHEALRLNPTSEGADYYLKLTLDKKMALAENDKEVRDRQQILTVQKAWSTANKQLAQNADRFRTTIALPGSSAANPNDSSFDASGVMATGTTPLGRGSSLADDFASAVTGGADKLQVETLGEEATVGGRPGLAGGQSGFGGLRGYRGGGGGGFGSGRGTVEASNEKEAGRVSGLAGAGAPAAVDELRVGDPSAIGLVRDNLGVNARQQEPPAMYWGAVGGGTPGVGAAGGQSFGFGNNASPANKLPESATPAGKFAWFADTDMNGLALAPAQPLVGRASPRAVAPSEPAPAIAANPMAAVDPATGLPVASTTAGKDSSRLGLWDTGVDARPSPVPPPVVAAQPVPSPAKPAPSDSYEFQVQGDIGGLKSLYTTPHQGQEGLGAGAPAKGLPVAGDLPVVGGLFKSESRTADAPSREGAVLAGDKDRKASGVLESAEWREARAEERLIPSRPIRTGAIPAAESPAPNPKPEATKATRSPDDVDLLLKQPETKAYAALIPPPATPAPSTPAATPVPALEAKEKNLAATQPLSVADDLVETIELGNIGKIPLATNGLQTFAHVTAVNDGLGIGHGELNLSGYLSDISGALITDPTHGTGDGREWGIRQKLDADGDTASSLVRLEGVKNLLSQKTALLQVPDQPRIPGTAEAESDRLADLTQMQSKSKALAGVQDKFGKAEQGGAGGVYSVNGVGSVNQTPPLQAVPPKPSPVVDKEQKKEGEIARYGFISVQRTNGSSGEVTVNYSTSAGAARPLDAIAINGNFPDSNDSKRVSDESLSTKSRVDIALPPGGENVQGVEREPRVQTGPVVINETHFNPPGEQRSSFAQRLNQSVNRGDRFQISGQAEGATESTKSFSERLREKQAELERLESLRAGVKANIESSAANLNLSMALSSAGMFTNASSIEIAGMNGRLGELTQGRDQRTNRITLYWQEQVDQAMPRSANVQIIDRAEAPPAKSSSLWGRITGAFSGDPVATARVAAEKIETKPTLLSPAAEFDPYWVQSELEKIQSKAVLQKVIEKLDLDDAWAKEHGNGTKLSTQDTLRLLKKKLDVGTKPNSSLIDIRVKDADSDEAARIANTIAEVYRDSRLAAWKEMTEAGQQALREQQVKLDREIARVKEELERRQKELKPEESDAQIPKLAATAGVPQPEIQSAENFFSTFSLNVSDVSFKLAAASLEKGQMPDPATVRSEEFINAFDYRDPEPKGSAPIAFAWERARYPFAHNRDLVRFSVKTAASGRQPGRPLNLVLLLDNSGSMERADRVRVIHECIRVLTKQLQPEDRVSVVAFARTARLVVDGFSGSNASNLPEVIGQLAPDGGTNLEEAMRVAYQTALKHFLPNGVNRVVLLTDGAANLGDVEPESLKKKVEAHRKQGVALDCFGIGWDGYNDDLLEVLSRNGDGRYGFVNTPEAAASEFAGQLAGALRVAASDVKVQVQFNPRRVTAWRQIGYAKHQLKKEQFRDNTVDAAEIGAAEQGNALYTVQVNPNGEGPLGVVRVRFKVPGTSDYREHEWAVPYSGAATPLEQSSAPMRLAATASAFSEWLVSSPFAGEVTPDRLLGYLSGVPESCAADPRPKKLEWMIRQARSLSGK